MIADEITERLQTLRPTRLEVVDDSAAHRGHGGWREGGETHFRIRMAAQAFAGLSRVARARLVHATLSDLVARIHALELQLDAA